MATMQELGRINQRRYSGVFFEEFLPELRGAKGAEVYTEMAENDSTIGAILFAFENLMRNCEFTIEPAGNKAIDKECAEFVQGCMDDMDMTWTDTLSEILSFITYGWSYHEIVYKRRMGRKKDANSSKYDHAAPHLLKENGSKYTTTESKDEYFINNYLMTDITLKDTIFYGAGLFCIGFDTQFAGLALHGYAYSNFDFPNLGWGKVAGTSYPARIKMQGDVRFYDWKEVNNIDSSTIVEGDRALLETIGLDLNVSNLLNKFNDNHPGNKVVYKYEGNDYINGAIVFYGGGKNYSWVETSQTNSNFNSLNTFEVPLSYFGDRSDLIYYAAGKESFKFMTYSSESNLTYVTQKNDLADGSAYSWIIRTK